MTALSTMHSPCLCLRTYCRAQLSYEQFSQFLHNIKELNAGRQSREETLRRARDIFGPAHQDMYGKCTTRKSTLPACTRSVNPGTCNASCTHCTFVGAHVVG